MANSSKPSDSMNRRGFLECMSWAGTGLVWTLSGGIPSAVGLGSALAATPAVKPFSFLQISDTHIGFDKPANPDVVGTLRTAIGKIKALPSQPAFVLHTGDITHLSKDKEFDDAAEILKEIGLPIFYVPGEHDVVDEGQGKAYLARYGQGTRGTGWQSFDQNGVHYIGLVNVANLKAGSLGTLGTEQLEWLEADVAGLSSSTPVVVFTHIPLWTVNAAWGWGTEDAEQALSYLKRFGSVTVLNGHIHQIMQKVEGNVSFHTARSTAYPQPVPGEAPTPGPLKVPAGDLGKFLGVRTLNFVQGDKPLAIVDTPLAG